MTAYTFETITAAQAASFSPADKVSVLVPNYEVGAGEFSLTYVADVGGVGSHLDIQYQGKTVSFGPGIFGTSQLFFAPLRTLYIGDPVGSDTFQSGSGFDNLFGSGGNDSLAGGYGADYLSGAALST